MARANAQLIQGTGVELLAYLEEHKDQRNLLLIIPQEEPADAAAGSVRAEEGPVCTGQAQASAVVRNGVPLFPTEGAAQKVTLELVKQLADEE